MVVKQMINLLNQKRNNLSCGDAGKCEKNRIILPKYIYKDKVIFIKI